MAVEWNGPITGITRVGAGYTGGITGPVTNTFEGLFTPISNRSMWDGAVFGVSVTTFNGVNFSVYVVGNLGGVQVPIAGLSGVGSTLSTLLPILNERILGTATGTTQSTIMGIPTPTAVVFGNSAIVGKSYSAIVYATLYRNY